MNPETVAALASLGTFVVISVSAVAALIQLRHIRASNQLSGLIKYSELWEAQPMQSAIAFVQQQLPEKLQDASYRNQLMRATVSRSEHPELAVCDWVEQIGSYVKYGLLSEEQFLDLTAGFVDAAWDQLEEVVALRRTHGRPAMYENFEYLAAQSKAWLARHSRGNYPPRVRRLLTPERAEEILDESAPQRT